MTAPSQPDALELALQRALAEAASHLSRAGSEAQPLLTGAERAVRGGKQLRARLCLAATAACGGQENADVAAALELFQAAALVHDDLMDAAETRRGEPASHRWFSAQLRADARGDERARERFGEGAAVLLGDLLLAWSATTLLAATADLPASRRAELTRLFGAMSAEVAFGQYLDLLASQAPWGDADALERAWRVIESKTARYSVELPLVIGAVLAGASVVVVDWLKDVGREVGVAYQLRDDVLGVFGEPARTGKPSGDDVREGKRTVLVELAYRAADGQQRAALEAAVGAPDLSAKQLAQVRSILAATGALAQVEALIAQHAERARDLLADPPHGVRDTGRLRELLERAVDRAA